MGRLRDREIVRFWTVSLNLSIPLSRLWIKPPQLHRFDNSFNGNRIGGGAEVAFPAGGDADHHIEIVQQLLLHVTAHFAFIPEEGLQALHPLKITDHHTAGITENVWNDGDALVEEDLIGFGRGGAVGALGNNAGADRTGILFGDLPL